MKKQPTIVFQDDDVVVINKPENYLSIPDRFRPNLPNVQKYLKKKFEQIFTVHRLDKETSGIMIFAKNEAAHKSLNGQFENRTVDKIYLALTRGSIPDEQGVIDKPIGYHPAVSGKMIITAKGKPSLSEYKVVERFKNFTLTEVNIKTGRTHQIRVHLESIGYPLAVDALYGRKNGFFLSELKGKKYRSNRETEERPLISRCTLHAFQLTFNHPSNGQKLSFAADPPKDFRAVLQQLRKWGT